MSESINKKYPTFCLLPFTHISTTNDGNYRACCVSEEVVIAKEDGTPYNVRTDNVMDVWNSKQYCQLRKDLLNGVKNSTCEYCWNYEATGAYSKRQKNTDEKHDMYPDYEVFINDALANDGKLSTPPTDLDLKVGTQCNLKCIMCYPGSSSLHQDEQDLMIEQGIELPGLLKLYDQRVKKFNLKVEDLNPKQLDVEPIVDNLDPSLSQALHMSLVGGEPLVTKTTQRLLEQCVDRGYAKNMMLQIISNLSVINPKTINLLHEFKHPMICASYDHIDPVKFNFIRFPADYSTFKQNFDTVFADDKIELKLSTTWGIFNIFDFEQIFEEWEQLSQRVPKRFVMNYGLIYYPNYFSLRYLEPDQKQEVTDRINDYVAKNRNYKMFTDNPEFFEAFKSVPGYMNEQYDDHELVCKERTRVLRIYDKIRGTDYKSLFPYIKNYE